MSKEEKINNNDQKKDNKKKQLGLIYRLPLVAQQCTRLPVQKMQV